MLLIQGLHRVREVRVLRQLHACKMISRGFGVGLSGVHILAKLYHDPHLYGVLITGTWHIVPA